MELYVIISIVTLDVTLVTKSHDPLSKGMRLLMFQLSGFYPRLGSPVVPFYPFSFGFPLLKPNSRKKGTLIIKGLLGNLVEETPRSQDRARALERRHRWRQCAAWAAFCGRC